MNAAQITKALQNAVGPLVEDTQNGGSRNCQSFDSEVTILKQTSWSGDLRKKLFRLNEAHHPLVVKLTVWGERFYRKSINNDRSSGAWMVVSGPFGTGKSTVSRRLARALSCMAVDASLGGWGGTVPSVWRGAWASISSHDKNAEFEDSITDLKTAHIVFLDDVGAEVDRFKQGETTARLCRVLDICQGKWLFITTNLDKPLIAAKYDHRVLDRMNMAHWCDLAGMPSYRSKIPKS